MTRSSRREREQEKMCRVTIQGQVQRARGKERGRAATGKVEGGRNGQRGGESEKKKLRMMTSAREDKFSLMSKKTKNRMIKRAPYVKMIAEI